MDWLLGCIFLNKVSFSILSLPIYVSSIYVCIHACTCTMAHVLRTTGSWKSKSGCLAFRQGPSLAILLSKIVIIIFYIWILKLWCLHDLKSVCLEVFVVVLIVLLPRS